MVGETTTDGDGGDGIIAVGEQAAGGLDAQAQQVLARTGAEGAAEGALELADR